ncbi:penicillin-binding protein 2A [Cytobacillus horneckiae]|uniref:Penicillin-binding protein n=2 Tax=Cytobacillus horneckiae TaxID=549687 RepID=A0A2N0ZHM8_9BACI|nr:PBP1A family penicillin-binding protein [Cytobacillus horneckiae]MBN6887683.1 PBP1A family penicillin-binding protein [Cytobacillus horneckiae]MEC1158216.1 PBP1A family penicillin-binding protein [Cytobacillus horneckiae]MED2940140.1 PBP1A family penicillin-binding protein [Cytobacillus horneckiae]PKG29025.1 penicillin-binding protein [Cytobacillus horneckiae]
MERSSWYKNMKSIWKRFHFTQILLLLGCLFALIILIFIYPFSSKADISAIETGLSQPTIIYDKNGDEASKISANKNEGVYIDDIPEHMKNAVIAIEDHRFYEHNGVDYKGIGRALVRNIKAGQIVEGGSTITQQLTKNALLTSEKTYERKIEEIFLSREIERKYSKNEILQMYLNQIYFGEGAYGIKRAAQKYYAKDVEELTLSESALLAGLIKAPSSINPYQDEEKALQRKDVVLNQMKKHGFITEEELEKAKAEELVFNDGGGDPLKGKYPYYVDAVLEEAMDTYDLNLDDLLTKGYHIYTELDPAMQAMVEKTYTNDSLFPESTGERQVQSGAIFIEPTSGGIQALSGGRGEHTLLGHNRAIHRVGQPGSTMKPIVPYAVAVEEGWNITDELKDEKMDFGDYSPNNYSGTYKGKVPMYEAVKDSLNLPAVWLYNEIGIEKGTKMAESFGIPEEAINPNLGLALGGTNVGVSPQNMAEAYSVFANDGVRVKSHTITKIDDQEGNTIAEWDGNKEEVISKESADKITSMLLGVVDYGTGKAAKIQGREVAGKTGSTQLPIEGTNGTKDQWFVGYTPQLVGAVWVGYDQSDENHYLTTTSSEGTAPLFKEMMSNALTDKEVQSFNVQKVDGLIQQQQQQEQRKEREERIQSEIQRFGDWFQQGRDRIDEWFR